MEIYFGSAFANMNLLSSSIGLAVAIPGISVNQPVQTRLLLRKLAENVLHCKRMQYVSN